MYHWRYIGKKLMKHGVVVKEENEGGVRKESILLHWRFPILYR